MVLTRRHPRRFLLTALALLWPLLAILPAKAGSNDKFTGKVMFMRHAIAPGTGDPNNFSINDCNTQRNLDDSGRAQAQAVGAKPFSSHGHSVNCPKS